MRASPIDRGRSRRAFSSTVLAIAIVGFGFVGTEVFGQTAYTSPAADPASWPRTFSVPNLTGTGVVTNPPTVNYFSTISAAANSGLIQLKGAGQADDPVLASGGSFELVHNGSQVFNITGNTEVGVPLYLRGTISFDGTSAVTHGFVHGSSLIRNLANNNVMMSVSYTDSVFSNQFSSVYYDIFKYNSVVLPTGNYRIETTLDITGQAEDTVVTTQSVLNDFNSTVRGGLATVLSVAPTGLGNSRTRVQGPQARDEFNVTGTGVKVGLFEPGRPYIDSDNASSLGITKHTSFGTRLSVSNVAGQAVGLRSEHAQSTASIIASANGDTGKAGIAPAAEIIAAPDAAYANFQAQLTDIITTKGARVINMSAGYSGGQDHPDTRTLDNQIIATPNVTFVKSAGNSSNFLTGARGNVSAPGLAYNIITVGGLDRNMVGRATYSSWGTNLAGPPTATNDPPYPTKPDIVAPSEYIQTAAARDMDGNTTNDDWTRAFLGDGFDTGGGPEVGDIAGTSFAAPHVAGAAALFYNYYDTHTAGHRQDHRVLKAVMLNTANRVIPKRFGGGAWAQTKTGTAVSADPLSVSASLDPELGAGLLDSRLMLANFQPWEVKATANNAAQKSVIDCTPALTNNFAWDFETVVAQTGGGEPGRVDYLLGNLAVGTPFRATLTWDKIFDNGTGVKANLIAGLELKLFHEGDNDVGNVPGWDNTDNLIATTTLNAAGNLKDNVKIFDFLIPNELLITDGFYLEVFNPSNLTTQYGLAFSVPEPTSLVLLVLAFPMLGRRRRSA